MPSLTLWRALGLAAALSAGVGAQAAGQAAADGAADINARYQSERKACLEGRSGQDQATCLKEAGAARTEALKHHLDNGEDRAARRANALQRCAVQPPSEREACEKLALGQGMQSGSVRDGGVIKELVTRVPADEPTKPLEPTRPATPASAAERVAPASAPASSPQPTR